MFLAPSPRVLDGNINAASILDSKIVTPGELITNDAQFMRGHGTFSMLDNGDEDEEERRTRTMNSEMYSSVVGTIEKVNKLISVHPMKCRYSPEIGDVVVGRILEVSQKRWKVDICARLDAILHLAAVNLPGGVQRRKLESDELQMRSFFGEFDLLVAEVQQISQDGNVSLHTRSLKYGKLRNGMLVKVPSHLVQRSKFHFLQLTIGVDVVLGVNGMAWISIHTPELTIEQVESKPDLLYTNKCARIPVDKRMAISRIANCIKALAEANVFVSQTSIMLAYELSLQLSVSQLLDPRHKYPWMDKVRQQIIENQINNID